MDLQEDYFKKNPIGIEFTDDKIQEQKDKKVIVRTLDDQDINIDNLVEEFKIELGKLDIQYIWDHNNKAFMPLRKFYATGLRNAYLSDKPEEFDETYQKLQELDIGIELRYYIDLRARRIQSQIYTKFFTDGPGLYSCVEDWNHKTYTGINAEFSSMNVHSWIAKANDPKGYNRELKGINLPSEFAQSYCQDWTGEYNERIFKLYGYPTRIFENQFKRSLDNDLFVLEESQLQKN